METLYPMKEGYFPETNGNPDDAAPVYPATPVQNQNYLNTIPHKGIFQPEPNTFICRPSCCCKFIGLFVFLYGCIFGTIFPAVGIKAHMPVMTIVGFAILGCATIASICVFCLVTTEVMISFSNGMVEITESSVCRKNKKIVDKHEIANILFEYTAAGKGVYQSLHIIYNNGIQKNYFGCTSNPPCFTKYEVDYFNNEVKRLLEN